MLKDMTVKEILAHKVNLPLHWKKINESNHEGYLTIDIVFKVRQDLYGNYWITTPFNLAGKELKSRDERMTEDACNAIALENFHELICTYLAHPNQPDLFAQKQECSLSNQEYQLLLNLSTEEIRERYLLAGR